jgi:hypothetical protein
MIAKSQRDRLNSIYLLGFKIREQQEAAVVAACTALGVDPDTDSTERDWCSEIVLHGTNPNIVIDRLQQLKESQ